MGKPCCQVKWRRVAAYDDADVPRARQILAAYGKRNASPFLEQVKAFKVLELEERHGAPMEVEVQVITLGDQLAWVGRPGEMMVDAAVRLLIQARRTK